MWIRIDDINTFQQGLVYASIIFIFLAQSIGGIYIIFHAKKIFGVPDEISHIKYFAFILLLLLLSPLIPAIVLVRVTFTRLEVDSLKDKWRQEKQRKVSLWFLLI